MQETLRPPRALHSARPQNQEAFAGARGERMCSRRPQTQTEGLPLPPEEGDQGPQVHLFLQADLAEVLKLELQ